jgi:hypothetical protein
MKILDRFTRDRQSRFIWGGATAVFLVLTLLALGGGRSALSREEGNAQDRAKAYTDTVLFDALDANLLADLIRGRQYRDLIIQVQGGIMTDEDVARVRIWAPDGTLLFSTESLEQIGVAKAVNSAPIEAAVQGRTTSVVSDATVAAKSGLSGTTQRLYQTFVPLRVRERTAILGVAEIDRTYAAIADAARQPWLTLQIGLGLATLLCAVLLLFSLRRSTHTLGRIVGSAPRAEAPSKPVPDDRNALRLRTELEREREANRRLHEQLSSATGPEGPTGDETTSRLAEAEWALAEAGAHAAELERSLAEATSRSVPPDVLGDLEERVVAAEARAREAELRLQDLSTAAAAERPDDAGPESDDPAAAPEAMDLRSRLARTAARKKLGAHPDDERGA